MIAAFALAVVPVHPRVSPRSTVAAEVRFAPTYSSSLAVSFNAWVSRMNLEGWTAPEPTSPTLLGPKTDKGMLLAPVGRGLYVGRLSFPRSQIARATARGAEAWNANLRSPPAAGTRIGLDGSVFLTRDMGVHFEVSAGRSWFAGLSLVYTF
jgi:hypothetical protein